jgi:tripartite-type tricarboxylate transporter receptor subunit TctC
MPGTLTRRALGGLAGLLATPAVLRAQSGWPNQPIKLVVPFAPGGTTDLVARLVSNALGQKLGQPIVIDNRPGAGATVGSELVARANGDGYTLLMSNIASHGVSPALYGNLRYDPIKDFQHIALVIQNPSVFVANKDSGITDLKSMFEAARKGAGGLDVGSSGIGSSNHLLIVQVGEMAKAPLNHIPFRGAGPAMTAVIQGTVPMMSDSLPSSAAHLKQGSVRGIAMASAERHPSFPDIPTFKEQGVDVVAASWFGLSAPASTPAAIVERINREVKAVLATDDMKTRFNELGGTAGNTTPAEYTRFIADELAHWAPVVKESGARAD